MRRFKPTEWVIEHRVPVYLMTVIVVIMGLITYINIPKEQFPDIVIPTIIIQTIYPGTSPVDVETLITRPIEKQLKSINGVKKVTSQSMSDVSVIVVEFQTNLTPIIAKQRVQDAVDKSKNELPTDLQKDPMVMDIDFSEIPIMYVNISGDVGPSRLKEYADDLKDKIEGLSEITRADIIGALEREIYVDLDLYKMQATGLTFFDVENSLKAENVNISGGEYVADGIRRNVRLISEFTKVRDLESIVIKSGKGNIVYLKDIAKINDDFKEKQSYARLDSKPVVTLSVIKRSGENLINASEKIKTLVDEYTSTKLPKSVKISITNDRSISTKTTLEDLVNTVIIGFILVTLILMFFMGVQDAMFIGLAVPISSFIAFLIMPTIGFTFNMVVTFAFLLALGIIVDDAIVVIENTHRLHTKEGYDIKKAAKIAAGEVFAPVFSGTLTTIAPFIPLLFFPGISGKFMIYVPAILILTLSASLIVAYLINPVLAVDFMDREKNMDPAKNKKHFFVITTTMLVVGILLDIFGVPFAGNLLIFLAIMGYLNRYFVTPVLINNFQSKFLPKIMGFYRKQLSYFLKGRKPYYVFGAMIVLFIFSMVLFATFPPKIKFFPSAEPNYIYVYLKMPIGTDAVQTDSVTQVIENKIYHIIGNNNPIVKSVITNVGIGAGDPMSPDRAVMPNKGKITIAFVEYSKRNGVSTLNYLNEIRNKIKNFPGAEIIVEQERGGPPTGKPISIEISGDNLDSLVNIEHRLREEIKVAGIQGIEKLNSDLQENKPEILVEIDRQRANFYGISSGQIGLALRTAIYGKEATKFRDLKDDYPIIIRIDKKISKDINTIMNMLITFREMSTGQFRQIPISAVTNLKYSYSYASINRKNQKRTITLSSNALTGFVANNINKQISTISNSMYLPEGYEINLTGEQQDQREAANFISLSFIISIFLILIILVTQFNSMIKPFIILTQVVLSTIGVFIGFIIFRIDFSIVLTGVGIVALAGIVVRNGIVLIDFIELIKHEKGRIRVAIIEGGIIRFNPVILTAAATVLGLIPLAIGFNINFGTLLTELNPHMYVGGDSMAFWGSMAWAIIFGLTFATFLTLIVVPCMYFIQYAYIIKYRRWSSLRSRKHA